MKLSGFGDLYGNLFLARATPQYVHPTGTQVAGNFGHDQNGPKFWPKIFNICGPSVPGGCTYWPALRGMKATYLGYKSVVVSFPDYIPLSRNVDLSVGSLKLLQNCFAALFLLKSDFGTNFQAQKKFLKINRRYHPSIIGHGKRSKELV